MQKEKWKTMDVILVILAIFLLVFVIVMIAGISEDERKDLMDQAIKDQPASEDN